jgi:hypothetical protein
MWRISDSPYSDFGWLAGANVLLYRSRDSSDVWSYDVGTKKNELSPSDYPWQPGANMLAALPSNARAIEVSPSGAKVLYTLSDIRATPTSYPDGETLYESRPAQLWVRDNAGQRPLGIIEDCVGSYLWSKDEKVAVVLPDSPPGKCEEAEAWILNLHTESLTPWQVHSDYDKSVMITDVKDDGSAVLFETLEPEGGLYIRNLSANHDRLVLNRPGKSIIGAWLNEGDRLLIDITDTDPLSSQLWTYEIGSAEPRQLEIPIEKDLFIGRWKLSHDRQWLAFLTTKYDEFQSNGLWVADLKQVQ